MGFNLTPEPGDPGDRRNGIEHAAAPAEERRIVRDGEQVIAHGALLCPECDLPMRATEAVPAGQPIGCGFCGHAAPAREFLRSDVFDTLANEVQLVARVGELPRGAAAPAHRRAA